eukprot:m.22423 g.22423  ORF g.22423 m.22423 type:complete len:242 (+) comp8838_c0_seq1:189-914(+)
MTRTTMLSSFAIILAMTISAQACIDGGCSLNLAEIEGASILAELDGCFRMSPNNTGYFFQLGGDIQYTAGVQFAECNEFGGCRCQNFEECPSSIVAEECTCFTPYQCEDGEGLFRCFELLPCENTAMTFSVQIQFNKPCVPTSTSTEDPVCDEKFLNIMQESAASCLKSCQVNDAWVLDEQNIVVEVRNAWDASRIQECINNQFVGAYDCFAVDSFPFSPTTTEQPTTTTTTTANMASTLL